MGVGRLSWQVDRKEEIWRPEEAQFCPLLFKSEIEWKAFEQMDMHRPASLKNKQQQKHSLHKLLRYLLL